MYRRSEIFSTDLSTGKLDFSTEFSTSEYTLFHMELRYDYIYFFFFCFILIFHLYLILNLYLILYLFFFLLQQTVTAPTPERPHSCCVQRGFDDQKNCQNWGFYFLCHWQLPVSCIEGFGKGKLLSFHKYAPLVIKNAWPSPTVHATIIPHFDRKIFPFFSHFHFAQMPKSRAMPTLSAPSQNPPFFFFSHRYQLFLLSLRGACAVAISRHNFAYSHKDRRGRRSIRSPLAVHSKIHPLADTIILHFALCILH